MIQQFPEANDMHRVVRIKRLLRGDEQQGDVARVDDPGPAGAADPFVAGRCDAR
jgi:hypothetical protein